MVTFDQSPFHRKHDGPGVNIVATPRRHYFPQSLQDLLEIIGAAESAPQTPSVRAIGSGWALSEAAVTQDFIVETHALNNILQTVIPGCLNEDILRILTSQPPRVEGALEPAAFNFVHVEAGIRLFDLYSRLDRRQEPDTPFSSLEAIFPNLSGPWALPTMGGAGGQTIVGAFSTGTHGAHVLLPPIADAEVAIHLVGAGQRQYWLERPAVPGQNFPLTADTPLIAAYPGVQIIRDADVFDAALVSVGRFGIIYSVILRVVRQFALHKVQTQSTWSVEKPRLQNLASDLYQHAMAQVVVNPHKVGDGHTAFVTTQDTASMASLFPPVPAAHPDADATPGRTLRAGANAGHRPPLGTGDFQSMICATASAWSIVEPILDGAFAAAIVLLIILPPPVNFVAFGAALAAIDLLQNLLIRLPSDGSFGDLLVAICNFCAANGLQFVIGQANEILLTSGLPPEDTTDVSYAIMDTFNYMDTDCITRGNSMEVTFDATAPDRPFLTFVELLFTRVRELLAGTLRLPDGTVTGSSLAFGGYVSLRFTGPTEALIGMQRWVRTCHVEVSTVGGMSGSLPLMSALEADTVALGGCVHWGQQHTLNDAQVQGMFPLLERWRSALAQLTDNGRLITFSTPFTRERGLEVIQPVVQSFDVQPRFYCSGEQLLCTWNAVNNPPGTQVSVQMILPDGSTAGSPILPLRGPDAHGPISLTVPAGISQVQLVAALFFAGIRREGRGVSIAVTAYPSESHPFRVQGTPALMIIDGEERWGVVVSLDPADWSANVKVGDMSLLPLAPALSIRRTGVADVLLVSPGIPASFLGDVTMAGDWLIFTRAAGAAPVVCGVDVRPRCG